MELTETERKICRCALEDLYEACHDGHFVHDAYEEIFGTDVEKLILDTARKLRGID